MKTKPIKNVYDQMQQFADITKKLIKNGDTGRAKYCIKIVENLFINGNREIKNAIKNVYLFSVSTFLEFQHYSIKNYFPETLRNEYYNQVIKTGD